jgi:hypothetical protein
MPTSGNFRVTVTMLNGTLKSYTSVGAVTISPDGTKKTFIGRREGGTPAETTDASITIFEDKILDEKVDPI